VGQEKRSPDIFVFQPLEGEVDELFGIPLSDFCDHELKTVRFLGEAFAVFCVVQDCIQNLFIYFS